MYKLYCDIESKDVVFESWGGSTKHPDSIYYYSDYDNKSSLDNSFEFNGVQWLAYIASNCLWGFHSLKMMKWIINIMGL